MKVDFQIVWVAWFHSFFYAKLELLKQLRSQAGAWERDEGLETVNEHFLGKYYTQAAALLCNEDLIAEPYPFFHLWKNSE